MEPHKNTFVIGNALEQGDKGFFVQGKMTGGAFSGDSHVIAQTVSGKVLVTKVLQGEIEGGQIPEISKMKPVDSMKFLMGIDSIAVQKDNSDGKTPNRLPEEYIANKMNGMMIATVGKVL